MEIKKIGVIGCGVLGGSIIQKSRLLGWEVFVWDNNKNVIRYCCENFNCIGLEDSWFELKNLDLVCIATPLDFEIQVLERLSEILPETCLVTDVGSVKQRIVQAASLFFPTGNFVGAHPMAGSEKTGIEFSKLDLFEGKRCFLTPGNGVNPTMLVRARFFWESMGAKVFEKSSHEHDAIVAAVSHLPQIMASTLCAALAKDTPLEFLKYAGNGFKDTTRIAASDPSMWASIILENKENIKSCLHLFKEMLADVESIVLNGDKTKLLDILESGNCYRKTLE